MDISRSVDGEAFLQEYLSLSLSTVHVENEALDIQADRGTVEGEVTGSYQSLNWADQPAEGEATMGDAAEAVEQLAPEETTSDESPESSEAEDNG